MAKFRLGFVALGCVVGFALVEVALRLTALGPQFTLNDEAVDRGARFADHPYLPMIGQPNYRQTLVVADYPGGPVSYEHNSYGFRTHEFPSVKTSKDYFVVCVGGSTVYGASDSGDTAWPAQLEAMLSEKYPELNVRVFNLGIEGGATASDIVVLSLVGAHLHPDLVVVYNGLNDGYPMRTESFKADYSHAYRDLDLERVFHPLFLALPSWMLNSRALVLLLFATGILSDNNAYAMLVHIQEQTGEHWEQGVAVFLRNLETLDAIGRSAGAITLFSTMQMREGADDQSAVLREFLERKKWLYVDQDALIPDKDPTLQHDNVHFTNEGDRLMAQNFLTVILEKDLVGQRRPVGSPVRLPF